MKNALIILSIALLSFFIGRYSISTNDNTQYSEATIERSYKTGGLTNPLLECEVNTYGSLQKYIPFENDIKDRIKSEIAKKYPDIEVALYFRNLRNGPWFGINEDAIFSPASLMKLPVTMAYSKWTEDIPGLMSMTLSGIEDIGTIQNIIPTNQIIPGKSYTIDELIRYSLIYSDNSANLTLLSNIPSNTLFKIFSEMNIPVIDEIQKGKDEFITVKEYASFFRILYNTSYLTQEKSEYLLNIMAQSVMGRGIRKTVPQNIVVSHKFGERKIQNSQGISIAQFHDCGIIYHPEYPYLLCIMTKGGVNMSKLESALELISTIIYSEIDSRYGKR